MSSSLQIDPDTLNRLARHFGQGEIKSVRCVRGSMEVKRVGLVAPDLHLHPTDGATLKFEGAGMVGGFLDFGVKCADWLSGRRVSTAIHAKIPADIQPAIDLPNRLLHLDRIRVRAPATGLTSKPLGELAVLRAISITSESGVSIAFSLK